MPLGSEIPTKQHSVLRLEAQMLLSGSFMVLFIKHPSCSFKLWLISVSICQQRSLNLRNSADLINVVCGSMKITCVIIKKPNKYSVSFTVGWKHWVTCFCALATCFSIMSRIHRGATPVVSQYLTPYVTGHLWCFVISVSKCERYPKKAGGKDEWSAEFNDWWPSFQITLSWLN